MSNVWDEMYDGFGDTGSDDGSETRQRGEYKQLPEEFRGKCEIIEAKYDEETWGDKKMAVLKLTTRVHDGEYKNCRIWKTLAMTPYNENTLKYTKQDLRKCGIAANTQLNSPEAFEKLADDLSKTGRLVEMYRKKPADGFEKVYINKFCGYVSSPAADVKEDLPF